jgi:hypothetical protein
VQAPQERQDLLADQAALGVAVRGVAAGRQPDGAAVRVGLLATDAEERPDDAVLAAPLDPARSAARDEAVEDRLDLVGRRVAGGAEPVGGEGVANLSQLVLSRAVACRAAAVDDLGAEDLAAKARILIGLVAPEAVIDVQRRHAVAELAQDVPEAGRIRPGGDEADDLAARRDQVSRANVALDPLAKLRRIHSRSVPQRRYRSNGPGIQPGGRGDSCGGGPGRRSLRPASAASSSASHRPTHAAATAAATRRALSTRRCRRRRRRPRP